MSPGWRGFALACPRCHGSLETSASGARCLDCAATYEEENGVLLLLAGRRGSPGYDPHTFGGLRAIEDRHFWFLGRCAVVLAALERHVPDLARRRLVDVGCGSGGLLAFLASRGIAVAGACDVYSESLKLVRGRLDVPLALVDDGAPPPLAASAHDLLGLFDVLEHLDDDVGLLKSLRRSLKPGGVLVLTVPAHPWLFDEMDEIAYHRRRYTRAALVDVLRRAGFEVTLASHFMAPIVPPLLAVRVLGRALRGRRAASQRRELEFRVVPLVNDLMRAVLALERALLGRVALPFGSSLVAVAVNAEPR